MEKTMIAGESQNPSDLAHWNLKQVAATKRKVANERSVDREAKKGKGAVCAVPQKFDVQELTKRGQVEMQVEARAHSIPYGGTKLELATRLRAHYEGFTHSRKPAGARPQPAAGYYDTAIAKAFANQKKQVEEK